jgi:hypothetical protein
LSKMSKLSSATPRSMSKMSKLSST